jgi:hypothetical protein
MFEKIHNFLEKIAFIFDPLKTHLLAAIAFVFWWLAPVHFSIAVVLVFISADTIAGRWAAKHQALREGKNPREVITSRKTRQGVTVKVIQYVGGIALTFLVDKLMLHDLMSYFFPGFPIAFFCTKFLAFIFVLMEFDSIDEKYFRVKGVSLKEVIVKKIKQIKKVLFEIINIKKEL